MTSENFVYWLQGFFELSDVNTINDKQTTMIKNHLNLVYKYELDSDSIKPNVKDTISKRFVISLMGFFEIYNPEYINENELTTIQKKLNLVFKHEIDLSVGDESVQNILNDIHKPNKPHLSFEESVKNNHGEALRCYFNIE